MEKSRLPLFGRTSSSKRKKQPVNAVTASFTNDIVTAEEVTTSTRRYHRDNSPVSTFVSSHRPLAENRSAAPKCSVSCVNPARQQVNDTTVSKKIPALYNVKKDAKSRASMSEAISSADQSCHQPFNRGHRSLPDKLQRPSLHCNTTDAIICVRNESNDSIPVMCRGSSLPFRRHVGPAGIGRIIPSRSSSNPDGKLTNTSTPAPNIGQTHDQSLSAVCGRATDKAAPSNDARQGNTDEPALPLRRDRLYSYPDDTECDEPMISRDQYKHSQPQYSTQEAGSNVNRKSSVGRIAVSKHQVAASEKQHLSVTGLSPGLSIAGLSPGCELGLSPGCECKSNIYESLPSSPIYETIDQVYVRAFPKAVSGAFVGPCCGVRMAELRATKRVSYTRSHSASPEPHSLTSPPPLPPRNPGTKLTTDVGNHIDSPETLLRVNQPMTETAMRCVRWRQDGSEIALHQRHSSHVAPIVDDLYTNTQTCLRPEENTWHYRETTDGDSNQLRGCDEKHSHGGDPTPVYSISSRRNVAKDITGVAAFHKNLPDVVTVIDTAAMNPPTKRPAQLVNETHTDSKNRSNHHMLKSHDFGSEGEPISIIGDTTILDGPHLKKTVNIMSIEHCDIDSKVKHFEQCHFEENEQNNIGNVCNKPLVASKLKSGPAQWIIVPNSASKKQNSHKTKTEISPASMPKQYDTRIRGSVEPKEHMRAPSKTKLLYSERQHQFSRSKPSVAKAKCKSTPVEDETLKKESSSPSIRANNKCGSNRRICRKQSCEPRAGRHGHDTVQSTSSNEPCSSVTSSCASNGSVFSEGNNVPSHRDPCRLQVLNSKNSRTVAVKQLSETSMDNGTVAETAMRDGQRQSKPFLVKHSKQHKLPTNRVGCFSDVRSCNSNASSRSGGPSMRSKQVTAVMAGRSSIRSKGCCDSGHDLGIDPVLDRCAYSEEKVKNWSCVPAELQHDQLLQHPTKVASVKNIAVTRTSSPRTSQQSKPHHHAVKTEYTSPAARTEYTSPAALDPCVSLVASQVAGDKPFREAMHLDVSPLTVSSQTCEQGSVNVRVANANKPVLCSSRLAKVSRLKPPGSANKSPGKVTTERKSSPKLDAVCEITGRGRDGLAAPVSSKTYVCAAIAERRPSVKHRRNPTKQEIAIIVADSQGYGCIEGCSSLGNHQSVPSNHAAEHAMMLVKPYSGKNKGQYLSRGIFAKASSFENDGDSAVQSSGKRHETGVSDGANNDSCCEPPSEDSSYNMCASTTTKTQLALEKQYLLAQETNMPHHYDEATLMGSQSDWQENSAPTSGSMSASQAVIQDCNKPAGPDCMQALVYKRQMGQDTPVEQSRATETCRKTSAMSKTDVDYQLIDQHDGISSQFAGPSPVDMVTRDMITKTEKVANGLSDAGGYNGHGGSDNVDCHDTQITLPASMTVQSGEMTSPEQDCDAGKMSEAPACVDKGCLQDDTHGVKPSHANIESSLPTECDNTKGSTESLSGQHPETEDVAANVKDTSQVNSDLLGNIRLNESGYDSWKSQGSNSTTCGHEEVIEIDVASWGIFDDKGETLLQKPDAVLQQELSFSMTGAIGRVCSEACPAASLSGSEDTLTPEQIIDSNDFGSEFGIGSFGGSGWIIPKDQSAVKSTRQSMRVCSSPLEQCAMPLHTECGAAHTIAGSDFDTSHLSPQTNDMQEQSAIDMLFSNMYSHANTRRNDTDKQHSVNECNTMSPVMGDMVENAKRDAPPVVKLRRPRTKELRLAKRPDTFVASTRRHSRTIEASSSCHIDDHRGENTKESWALAPSPLYKSKRHSTILSCARVPCSVVLSASSPSLDTVEQEREEMTSFLLDDATLRRSAATSTLNMQRQQCPEDMIVEPAVSVETAVSETSIHVQPADQYCSVNRIGFETTAEKSVHAITEAVSEKLKSVADKNNCEALHLNILNENRVTRDAVKGDCRASEGCVEREEDISGVLPQPISRRGICVGISVQLPVQSNSVTVSSSSHKNSTSKSKLQAPSSHQRLSRLRPVTTPVKSTVATKPANVANKHSTKNKEPSSPGRSFQSVIGSIRQATVTLYRKTNSRAASPGDSTMQEATSKTDAGRKDVSQKLATGLVTKSPGNSGIPSADKNATKQSKSFSFTPELRMKSSIPGNARKKAISTYEPPVCEKIPLRCTLSDPSEKQGTNAYNSQIPPRSPARTSIPTSGIATKVGLSRISRPVHPRVGTGKSLMKLPRPSEDSRR